MRRLAAIVLSLAIFLEIANVQVYAYSSQNQTDMKTEAVEKYDKDLTKVAEEHAEESVDRAADADEIVGEIESKRDEYSKHFRRGDGSIIAASYYEPIHYEANGQYLDIDNALIPVLSDDGSNKIVGYKNAANSFDVNFAADMGTGSVAELTDGRYSIRWNMVRTAPKLEAASKSVSYKSEEKLAVLNGNAAEPMNEYRAESILERIDEEAAVYSIAVEVEEIPVIEGKLVHEDARADTKKIIDEGLEKFTLDNIKTEDSVYYTGVMNGVDVQYLPQSDGLKENILINEKAEQYEYTFVLQLTNLKAMLSEENEILLYDVNDGSEPLYRLVAPYMFDGGDAYSDAVLYKLEERHSTQNEKHQYVDKRPEITVYEEEEVSATVKKADESIGGMLTLKEAKDKIAEQYFEQMLKEISADELLGSETREYTLTLEADAEWINAAERIFPVTIDPVVKKITSESSMSAIGECAGLQSSGQITQDYINVGRTKINSSSYTDYRGYFKPNMPILGKNDIITECKLSLRYEAPSNTNMVCLYEVPDIWTADSITWDNQPFSGGEPNGRIVDYCKVSGNGIYKFDITASAKNWYENKNENNGLFFAPYENGQNGYVKFSPYNNYGYNYNGNNSAAYLTVTYRDNTGIESYWTSHNQSVGRAGIGSVNDSDGRLTFVIDDVGTVGSRMQAVVQHVYNSNLANEESEYNMSAGNGWKLNYMQTLRVPLGELDINDYNYIYTDADGTKHAFKTSNISIYENGVLNSVNNGKGGKDEDGLGLYAAPVTQSTSNTEKTKIQDKAGSRKMYFDGNGRLVRLADSSGNAVILTYGDIQGGIYDQRLVKITDAAGIEILIEYDGNGRICSITDPTVENGTVDYTYDASGNLTAVTYADGETCHYEYSPDGMLISATDPTGYKVIYGYSGYRVTSITESAKGEDGQTILIEYGENDTTRFRFSGPDEITGNDDDILNIYTFDKAGKTESICSRIVSSNEILGVSKYTYTDGSSSLNDKNNLKEAAQSGGFTDNLLKNPSFEFNNMHVWTTYRSGNSDGNYTFGIKRMECPCYIGAASAVFESASNHTGEVGLKQSVNLQPGEYTLSGYVSTNDLKGNAYLAVHIGDEVYESEKITGTTNSDIDGGWVRLDLQFSVDETTSADIILATDAKRGRAIFDCIQLETGSVANRYNIIDDGSFEKGSGIVPETALTDQESVYGSYSCKIDSKDNANNGGTVKINTRLGAKTSSSYMLTGWYKVVNGVPAAYNRMTYIGVKCNGTNAISETVNLNADEDEWTYFALALPSGEWSGLEITVNFGQNIGTMYLDGLQLVENDVERRTYYNNGRIKNRTVNGVATEYTYDSLDRFASETKEQSTTYTYNTKNQISKITMSTGVEAQYYYDRYGNLKDQSVTGNNVGIYTGFKYDSTGRFMTSETDARGNTTSYSYDELTGNVTRVTNSKNTATEYSYNNYSQVTSVTSGAASVSYGYDADHRLDTISHNGFAYEFSYDNFGNGTGITIAGEPFISKSYSPRNGKQLSTSYANGYVIEPVYNYLEQLVAERWNGEEVNEYRYNKDGQLVKYIDKLNGMIYAYEYNIDGRLINKRVTDLATGKKHLELQNTYDSVGHTSGELYYINGERYELKSKWHEDNLLQNSILPRGDSIYNTYDSLRRLTGIRYSPKGSFWSNQIATEISYAQGAEGSGGYNYAATSGLVERYVNKIDGNVESSYTYAYDSLGNITSIKDKDNIITRYQYDSLSQLVRENNGASGKTFVYSYDAGGNITSVKEYAYTMGALGTPISEKNYEYASDWRDKLVYYNGESIEYDAIGNPTKYLDKQLEWSYGRQLTGVSTGGKNISYTYTTDGIRRTKTVNGVTTEYTLNGSQILREKTGDKVLNYYYDGNGCLASMGYVNGSSAEKLYTFTRNAQGDIIGVYECVPNQSNGIVTYKLKLVGTYSYDARGNIIAVTPASARSDPDRILQKNPFRYRGYYYDTETGFYYLQSRYYDPAVRRFINADTQFDDDAGFAGYNLFAYCANNPVLYKDDTGTSIILTIIICAAVGFVVGAIGGSHYAKYKKNLTPSDGWDYWKYVLLGGGAGGALGALLGWGVGSLASTIGVKLVAGSSGTLGSVIYSSWQKAEDALRNAYNGAKATFNTPFGNRIVDAYSNSVIREAKYGYQSLSQFIQEEINKDIWILNNTSVKSVEWHFYWSKVSDSGGPSGPLLKELAERGIKVIFH